MATVYEKIVEEDLNLGEGTVEVTMPGGGTQVGHRINLNTFMPASSFFWTPAFASTGVLSVTHAGQHAHGVRMGRAVSMWLDLQVSAVTPGATGDLLITGLPYTAESGLVPPGVVNVSAFSPVGIAYSWVSGYVAPGTNLVALTYVPGAGATQLLYAPASMLIADSRIWAQITYLIPEGTPLA